MIAFKVAFWWACFVTVAGMLLGLYGATVNDMAFVALGGGLVVSGATSMALLAIGLEHRTR